jgi:hypothetical protein
MVTVTVASAISMRYIDDAANAPCARASIMLASAGLETQNRQGANGSGLDRLISVVIRGGLGLWGAPAVCGSSAVS